MKKLMPVLVVFTLLFCRAWALQDVAIDDLPVTDGEVRSAIVANGTLYIGGFFTAVGPHTGSGVALSASTAALIPGYPAINGYVSAVVPDGNNGWFVGGNFTQVGAFRRRNMVHLKSDGSVDPAFDPSPDIAVICLLLHNGRLFVGGGFNGISGKYRPRLAALDPVSGDALNWFPNVQDLNYINCLAATGNTLYFGGSFSEVNGQSRGSAAAVDVQTAALLDFNPKPGFSVYAIAVNGSTVFLGGNFSTVGGVSSPNLCAVDADPTSPSFNRVLTFSSCDSMVNKLVVNNNVLYVAGQFSNLGGQARTCVGAIDADRTSATFGQVQALNLPVGGAAYDIAVDSNRLYVGGISTRNPGFSSLSAYDLTPGASYGQLISFDPALNEIVFAVAVQNGVVFAGGRFSGANMSGRKCLAAIDLSTRQVTAWNPGCTGTVTSLASAGTKLYVGGGFTTLGGASRTNLAAVDIDPLSGTFGQATAWNPATNLGGTVQSLQMDGTLLYAGGDFTTIGGVTRHRLAAIDADPLSGTYGQANAFNPDVSTGTSVATVAALNPSLYAAGTFSVVGGQTHNNLAGVDINSGGGTYGQPLAFSPSVTGAVTSSALDITDLYIGGALSQVNGSGRGAVARVDANPASGTYGQPLPWAPSVTYSITSVSVDALGVIGGATSTILIGGRYDKVNSVTRNRLAAMDNSNTGTLLPWNPQVNVGNVFNTIRTFCVTSDTVYVGGEFLNVGGAARRGLAAFKRDPVVPVITALVPASSAVNAGALTLVVAGNNFSSECVVRWNGIDRTTTYNVNRPNEITATIPASEFLSASIAVVEVFSSGTGGGSSNTLPFTVSTNNPAPLLTWINPNRVGAGSVISIFGDNFVASSVARLNGSPHATTFVNRTQLTITLTSADVSVPGDITVDVVNPGPGGGTSGLGQIVVTSPNPLPAVTGLNPASVAAGSNGFTLIVIGSNFVPASSIIWRGTTYPTTWMSSSQLSTVIPSSEVISVGTANVSVSSPGPGGGSSNVVVFNIVASDPAPVLSSLSPALVEAGGAGFTLTLTGSSFVPGSIIKWNSSNRPTTYISDTTLRTTVSAAEIAAPTTKTVQVFNPGAGGGLSATLQFNVRITPTVSWAPPSAITYGTPLSATQLNATSSAPGTMVYTPAAGTVLNTGAGQLLSVTFNPTDPNTYNSVPQSTTITVLKKPLQVVAQDQTRQYGAPNPTPTFVYSGLVNGDGPGVIDVTPAVNIAATATPTAQAGSTHAIIPVGGSDNNYTLSYVNGVLTITKATPVITWAAPADIQVVTPLNSAQLNASANVPGTFVYTPAAGALLPKGHGQTLTVAFTPQDTTNYQTASATVSINVLSLPVFTSAPTVAPLPAYVGSTLTFTAVAVDPDDDPVNYVWSFGDGASSTGSTVTHAFAQPGTYTALVSAGDGTGANTQTVTIKVNPLSDRDGDGFPDDMELAVGSDPLNADSTPVGSPALAPVDALTVAKLSIHLNFAKRGSDSIAISGILTPSVKMNLSGQSVAFYIGGVTKLLTVNGKRQKGLTDTIKVTQKPKANTLNFSALFKGDFASTLANTGLTGDAKVKNAPHTLTLLMASATSHFAGEAMIIYSATPGKTGSAKNARQ